MIELNKIYCENCLDTLARMPDEFVDLTMTSPPYDDMDENFNPKEGLREYNGYSWDFKEIAKELFRVTKKGGVVVWVINDPTIDGSESLASSLQKIFFRRVGFNIHDTMIYHKESYLPQNQHPRYSPVFEYMIILCKGYPPKTFNAITQKAKGGYSNNRGQRESDNSLRHDRKKFMIIGDIKRATNIWSYPTGGSTTGTKQNDHIAAFQEKLARDHIYSWSNEGDLIYDPFMGSGTTAKMAHLMKRNWIGSEISQEYVDLANKRLEKYLNQTDLFASKETNGKAHGEQSDIFTRLVLDDRNGKNELKQEKVIL